MASERDRESEGTTSAADAAAYPLAAIDVGSNTIHLVVGRPLRAAHDLEVLADEVELIRLGADVNALGAVGPERMAKAVGVVNHQAEVARGLGARLILGIATEGVRAARNGAELMARVRTETGVELTLVTGEQEAALTFWGATSGRALDGRQAVIDLGGGSLELVVGDARAVLWRVSLPLGSGVMHDQLASSDPADVGELVQVAEVVRDTLDGLAPPLPVHEVTTCGGTATTLAWLARRALNTPLEPGPVGAPEDPRSLPALTEEVIEALLGLLQRMPAGEVTRRFGVEEERARLLPAGAVVLREAMRRLEVERLRVTRRGIREGAILAYARHGADWLAAAARG